MTIIPVLQLPFHLRKDLSKPLGVLYVSDNTISGFKVDYSVGDVVSRNQISEYRVVDNRVMRTRREIEKKDFCDIHVVNPPGTISLNTLTFLNTRFFKNICIIGEEDLVVLGIGRDRSVTTAYGQPRVGVVLYKTDPVYIVNIIKTFKPTLIVYNNNHVDLIERCESIV
ncbi:MAG: DUF359 domain-containing protein [Desulfurococcaceae archaeon]|uniref:DUF359 domain-containing protein n=1 Tax=Staphylothermus marinus TaxID=2280 RepID=A0A7C4DA66_STAMA